MSVSQIRGESDRVYIEWCGFLGKYIRYAPSEEVARDWVRRAGLERLAKICALD